MNLQHRRFHGRHEYRCPMCPQGWMTGGAMWQHLRGFSHVCAHDVASDIIYHARTGEWRGV